jgi:hypothetical protein
MSLVSILISYRLSHPVLPCTLFRSGFQQAWGGHLSSLERERSVNQVADLMLEFQPTHGESEIDHLRFSCCTTTIFNISPWINKSQKWWYKETVWKWRPVFCRLFLSYRDVLSLSLSRSSGFASLKGGRRRRICHCGLWFQRYRTCAKCRYQSQYLQKSFVMPAFL